MLTWGNFNEENLTKVPNELHGGQDGDLREKWRHDFDWKHSQCLLLEHRNQAGPESHDGQHLLSTPMAGFPKASERILEGGMQTMQTNVFVFFLMVVVLV